MQETTIPIATDINAVVFPKSFLQKSGTNVGVFVPTQTAAFAVTLAIEFAIYVPLGGTPSIILRRCQITGGDVTNDLLLACVCQFYVHSHLRNIFVGGRKDRVYFFGVYFRGR